jgi:peptide/nickel transport system ATP-binding protein
LTVEFDTEDGVVHAVTEVSYDLHPGEVLGVVGESGSGKSVSMLSVLGLIPVPPARISGEAIFKGDDLLRLPGDRLREIRGGPIAMIFQDPMTTFNPVLTIGDQISEAITVHNPQTNGQSARRRTIELLEFVGVSSAERRVDQYPPEFSGGMRQRAMIAMAIANDPSILIADEPTTALDVTIQAQIVEVLKTAQTETHAAIILITHDLGLIAELADRVVVMYAGRVVELGDVFSIFNSPRHPYTVGLLNSLARLDADKEWLEPIPGQPPSLILRLPVAHSTSLCAVARPGDLQDGRSRAACPARRRGSPIGVPLRRGARVPSGRGRSTLVSEAHTVLAATPAMSDGDDILRVEGLVKHFPIKAGVFKHTVGHIRAVDGIDLSSAPATPASWGVRVRQRRWTHDLKLIELTAGRIVFDGRDITALKRRQMRPVRRDLQIVFQDPYASLNPRMTVREIVAEPLRIHGFYGGDDGKRRVEELLRTVGLSPEHANRFPHEFSGGQRQRIGVARALALEPKLIVLDEPVSALDVSIQAQVLNLLAQLRKELRLTYVLIAHDLSVVRHVSDRVAVMYLGKVVEVGTQADHEAPHPFATRAFAVPPNHRAAGTRTRTLEGDVWPRIHLRGVGSARAAGRRRGSAPRRCPP